MTIDVQDCLKILAVAQLGGRSPKSFIDCTVMFSQGEYIYKGIIKGFTITEKDGLVFTAIPNGRSVSTKSFKPDAILFLGSPS